MNPSTHPKQKKRWINGLLFLGSSLMCFALIELGLRLTGYSGKELLLNRILIADDLTGFRLKPNSHQAGIARIMPKATINSLGMRDKEYNQKKPDDTLRILALGDSFAYGRVEDEFNFLTLVEERWNHTFQNAPLEIFNSGVPAYQPVNQRAYLQHYGIAFEPDAVLLCFYVGNDLWNNHLLPTEINATLPIEANDNDAEQLPFYKFLRWSEVYWTVINIYANWNLRAQIQQRIRDIPASQIDRSRRMIPDFWFMDEEQYRQVLQSQVSNHLKAQHRRPDDNFNLQSTLPVIEQIHQLCAANRMDFAVALLPSEAQVDEKVKQMLIESAHPFTTDQLDFQEPQATLSAALNQLNISTIDLLPAFIEKGKSQRLYLLQDTHWNEEGNALAADILWEALQNRLPPQ